MNDVRAGTMARARMVRAVVALAVVRLEAERLAKVALEVMDRAETHPDLAALEATVRARNTHAPAVPVWMTRLAAEHPARAAPPERAEHPERVAHLDVMAHRRAAMDHDLQATDRNAVIAHAVMETLVRLAPVDRVEPEGLRVQERDDQSEAALVEQGDPTGAGDQIVRWRIHRS